jgi:isoamylase
MTNNKGENMFKKLLATKTSTQSDRFITNDVLPGRSFPLGATVYADGVNFSIFSRAEALELLLFDYPEAPRPSRIITLDPKIHCSCNYWHVFITGIKSGQAYAYRAHGEYAPEKGLRFDGTKVLLDPYAKAIAGEKIYNRQAASQPGDNCDRALRGVVVDTSDYDWSGDRHPRTPYATSIIYELHVGGFTSHPNSGVSKEKRGTFAGLIEKIPYLQQLGITAVELLPIHYFDVHDAPVGLENYWGYSTIGFFAPYNGYSSRSHPLEVLNEFRDLVKALHQAGIEIILDVVLNHTAEGNERGPTISFRGLDNQTYYILSEDSACYHNYSGCGNSLKANHPVVSKFIIDCLNYWVTEMHVDGFRFDLASVLARDAAGASLWHTSIVTSNILWAIESDPVLAGTKLIAEAWDAAGLYGVGRFVDLGDWFSEWNGPFRDDVRRFIKGDSGTVSHLAARILASPDMYFRADTDINRSINFITCHDGFTLNDLVTYNQKHNQANGNDNHSWNCGTEGAKADPAVEKLRLKQIKNFFTVLLMSQGTPMILMGDEVRRTQQGNNNVYCQNNQLSWFDWSNIKSNLGLFRFVKSAIAFIQSLEVFRIEQALATIQGTDPYLIWHGVKLHQPNWSENAHYLAFTLTHPQAGEYLHVMFNTYWQPLTYELPLFRPGHSWYRIIDTSLPTPDDFCDLPTAPIVTEQYYLVEPRSSVVLMAK